MWAHKAALCCTFHSVVLGCVKTLFQELAIFDVSRVKSIGAASRSSEPNNFGSMTQFGGIRFACFVPLCGDWERCGTVCAHAGLRVGLGPLGRVVRGFWSSPSVRCPRRTLRRLKYVTRFRNLDFLPIPRIRTYECLRTGL